jgi:Fe2+ transport system protein FeoA
VIQEMLFWQSMGKEKSMNLPEARHINITQLDNGKSATVLELNDNSDTMRKLLAMGIIPGAVITKKSAIPSKGPVILEKDKVQFAIGYDRAQNIIVEPLGGEWESVNE